MDSKKAKLIEVKNRLVVSGEWGKWGDISQRMQTSSYKIFKLWGFNEHHADYS